MSRGVALGTALTPQALHAPRPAPFIVTVIDRMAEVSSSLWVCVICSIGPPRTGCPRPSPGVFGPSPRRRLQHLTPVPDSLGLLCQCFSVFVSITVFAMTIAEIIIMVTNLFPLLNWQHPSPPPPRGHRMSLSGHPVPVFRHPQGHEDSLATE